MTDLFTNLPHSVRFAEKWAEWIVYKSEIKDSYKSPKSASAKAKQLSKYSEDVAIQMIDESIANGYKGIFPLKATNGKQVEPNQTYRTPDANKLSDYKPKPYDRAKGIQNMRDKLKRNFENGTPIRDWGDIYTNLLTEKCGMDILKDTERIIREDVELDANRKRNRFEPQYTGNVESDVRDKCLNHFLKECRESGRKIYKEI